MIEPWLLYFAIFAAVFLLVQFAMSFFIRELPTQRRVAQRFGGSDRVGDRAVEIVKRRNAGAGSKFIRLAPIEMLLVQSGLEIGAGRLALAVAALWLAVFAALSFLSIPFSALIAAVAAVSGTLGFLMFKRARRVAQFAEQLPDVIDVVVRSLKAGHPLPVSLSLVAREMPDPAGREFAIAFDEITYGREVREALENLYGRVGLPDLKFLVTSIAVSHQTGGNLGDILSRLSRLIRERFRMKRKIQSLSAEGRFSALALSLFPFILFGVVNLLSPTYYGDVWGHPALFMAFSLCGVLLVIGNFVMYRMVNFKF